MKNAIDLAALVLLCSFVNATAAAAPDKKVHSGTTCQQSGASRSPPGGTALSLQAKADRGDVEAMNALAIMYAQGLGIPKNSCRAMMLFRQSAAAGHAPAMVNLGMMHAKGIGMRRDEARAYAWIRAALYVGVSDEEHDATVFKLGMVAGRLDVAQVERAEAIAEQIARTIAIRNAPSVEGNREKSDDDGRT